MALEGLQNGVIVICVCVCFSLSSLQMVSQGILKDRGALGRILLCRIPAKGPFCVEALYLCFRATCFRVQCQLLGFMVQGCWFGSLVYVLWLVGQEAHLVFVRVTVW